MEVFFFKVESKDGREVLVILFSESICILGKLKFFRVKDVYYIMNFIEKFFKLGVVVCVCSVSIRVVEGFSLNFLLSWSICE